MASYTPFYKKTSNKDLTDYPKQEIDFYTPLIKRSQIKPIPEKVETSDIYVSQEPIQEEYSPEPYVVNWKDTSREGKSKNAKQYLMDLLGLKDFQAAALVGTFLAESKLEEGAKNQWEASGKNSNVKSNQYGIGINQWTHDRHDNFVRWTKRHGNSLQSQLEFAADEIKRKFPEYLNALQSADTLDEATGYTYAMYTGANHRNVNKDNWKNFVAKTERPYIAMAKKNGWNLNNVGFNKRLTFANEAMSYNDGGKVSGYQKQFDLTHNPFK